MNVLGKSRDEIQRLTSDYSRPELVDLIYKLSSLEPMFTPLEVAKARQIAVATVRELIQKQKLRAHRVGQEWRIPLSAIQEWDASTSTWIGKAA